ncbi:uncharacterized protein LOC111629220 [Centruroides sculpturatus]|uniref:uncharacterized protein LOC111629220 n=1 Tax=Centruroides sculpturatus TaxID=218467 RepID=UPI000C6DFF36|nr:uncharacterized protein LOC111629220 [Centruroides sculpturatus]
MLRAKFDEETQCQVLVSHLIDTVHEQCEELYLKSLITQLFESKRMNDCYKIVENLPTKIKLKKLNSFTNVNISEKLLKIYNDNVIVTLQKIIQIAFLTRKQSTCPDWFIYKQYRLSSSMAHSVKTRKNNFEKLAFRFLNNTFKGTIATDYGIKLEQIAKNSFSLKKNIRIIDAGVIICNEAPWICASPDGICKKGNKISLLEIKCPYTCKDKKIVDFKTNEIFVKYLEFKNSKLYLKENSRYYTQIQLALYVTNIQFSYLSIVMYKM